VLDPNCAFASPRQKAHTDHPDRIGRPMTRYENLGTIAQSGAISSKRQKTKSWT
jgi:hypothetical protein